ncbi:MAG: hypothetical protein NTAFB01_04680 [Nitrospira sp.]
MNILFGVLALIASLSAGCATIVSSSTVDVSLATTPAGAKAQVNGQTYATTNSVTIPIRRGKNPTIHVEKDGYEPQDIRLERKFGGWVWGNILFGGLIGLGIDLITEHAYGVEPDDIHITLQPVSAALKQNAPTLIAAPVSSPPPLSVSDVDSPPVLSTRRRNAHAIVIGLEIYRNQLPKADYAETDAKVVAQYLSKSMGFEEENIALLVNERASKSDLEKYFETWLPNRVEKDDTVFIYYSGHGAPNTKTNEAFLVPYDGDPVFLNNTGYSLNRLYQNLANLPAKEIIVVLDSCFSGSGGRSVIAKGMRPIITEVRNPILGKGKTVVIAASTAQQISTTYDQQRHGLFTYFFLKGLQGEGDTNKNGKIEVAELFGYLRPQVERIARRQFNTEQTPQLIGSTELISNGINLLE